VAEGDVKLNEENSAAIDQGKLDKTSDFYQAIKAVKDQFPKS
jgi:hypothetical protein